MKRQKSGHGSSKELRRIQMKSFRHNRLHFNLFVLCGSLAIALIFNSFSVNTFLTSLYEAQLVSIGVADVISSTLLLIAILCIFLLVLSIINYMRTRSKDYGMFLVFGMPRNMMYLCILREYLLSWALSLVFGILSGLGITYLLHGILGLFYAGTLPQVTFTLGMFTGTLFWSFGIFGITFIVCHEMLSCLGMSEMITLGRGNRKPVKHKTVKIIIGILLLLFQLHTMSTYTGQRSIYVPIVVGLIGLYMVINGGSALLLQKVKSNKHYYYSRVLKIHTFYRRFFCSIKNAFCTLALTFLITFLFLQNAADTLYKPAPEEAYPYDIVWMANAEDSDYLSELKEQYDISYEAVPFIRITSIDYGESIAMSETTYKEWTGKTVPKLGKKEIYMIYQRKPSDRNALGISYGYSEPFIHIGTGSPDLWFMFGTDFSTPLEYAFSNDYHIAGAEETNLTGSFRDSVNENIVIFSDAYYDSVKSQADGANLMVLMDIPKASLQEVNASLDSYAAEHSYPYFMDQTPGLYVRDDLVKEDEATKLTNIVTLLFSIILVFICSLFMIGIKVVADLPEMEEKYAFLHCMGMRKKDRLREIRRECRMSSFYPVLLGFIWGIIVLIREFALRHLTPHLLSYYVKTFFALELGFLLLYVLYTAIITVIITKKIERKDGGN